MSDNEQRDELARDIFIADNSKCAEEIMLADWAHPDHHYPYTYGIADGLIAKGYRKPRTITTVEELDALPIGSVVLAHWPDDSQSDYQMTRCPEGAASAGGGFGVGGGSHWLNMWSWGAVPTVLHEATP